MSISLLEIFNFRNFEHTKIIPSNHLNIFFGENGSGKTSILESIYHLSFGKSFRTSESESIIKHGADRFTVFGNIHEIQTGFERHKTDGFKIKVNNKEIRSISELAKNLPLQLISPDCYDLVFGGPSIRREFMDFGLFHVEHNFLPVWRKNQKILRQRNSILKFSNNIQEVIDQITHWNNEFIETCHEINNYRKLYIDKFESIFIDIFKKLIDLDVKDIHIDLYPGWEDRIGLEKGLEDNLEKDFAIGYTQIGSQRADLVFSVNKKAVSELFSRGETKIFVYAMQLAQAILLKELTNKKSIFLIDDMPSELDFKHRSAVYQFLEELDSQVFITGIESESFSEITSNSIKSKMFHVEHDTVNS